MLSKMQMEHAKQKAAKIYHSNAEALQKKYVTPEVKLGNEAKHAALLAGEFTFRDPEKRGWRDEWWFTAIKFNAETPEVVDPKFGPAAEKLAREYSALLDNIVLGEGTEAIRLLEAFAKFEEG